MEIDHYWPQTWYARGLRLNTSGKLGMNIVDYLSEIIRLFKNAQLTVGTCSMFKDLMNIVNRLPASQIYSDIAYKIQKLINQSTGIYFLLFSKIDQMSFNAITAGAPFIFIDIV